MLIRLIGILEGMLDIFEIMKGNSIVRGPLNVHIWN